MRRTIIILFVLLAACQPVAGGEAFTLRLHPDGILFVGDQVSFEVIAPPGYETTEKRARVSLEGELLGEEGFGQFGVGQRNQATFYWAWDTGSLQPGSYTLTFSILPDGPTWHESLRLHESEQVPPPEPGAHWVTAESDCCLVHYVTGTEAERDLSGLLEMVDEQAQFVEGAMQATLDRAIDVTFLPRTLGHGGFASSGIYVSYLDMHYAGGVTAMVVRHEMVHDLDRTLAGDYRPSLLVEGLAVYLSGGHFKPEPLRERAAALVEAGLFIPLQDLANDFYTHQHEIEYLQAGALIAHLVDTYGWEAFNSFYRHIHLEEGMRPSQALDSALQEHFHISLSQLEQDFLAVLKGRVITQETLDDLLLTVELYDTIRRYQAALDPSAYFLTAWLPDGPAMQEHGIVADVLRRPRSLWNSVIEPQLVEADRYLRSRDYDRSGGRLERVNLLLDFLEWLRGGG